MTLEHFSRRAGLALSATLIALPLALVAMAAFDPGHLASPWTTMPPPPGAEPGVAVGALLFAVRLAALAPLLVALHAAKRLFDDYADGRVFTPLAVARLQRVSRWMVVAALVQPVAGAASTALYSLAVYPPGERFVTVSLSSDQILLLVFAMMFAGIARAMQAAVGLAEDVAAIV